MNNNFRGKLIPMILALFLVTTILTFLTEPAFAAETILQTVDFETDLSGYTITGEQTSGVSDWWQRTDGTAISPDVAFTGCQGTYYFYGEDTDNGRTAEEPAYVTLNSVNVTGYSNLQVKILLAANDNTDSSYEGTEYLKIQYSFDGGEYVTRAQYIAEASDTCLTEDANADGTKDGTSLSTAFTEYTYSIPSSGTNLQIRIAANVDQGREEVGFDNIRITGEAAAISAPSVTTNAATEITSLVATLNGTVNANNDSTAVTFEYGTTTSYGTSVSASPATVAGDTATSVSRSLTGLTPNTTYHYRAVGVNSGGTTYGSDSTFTTEPADETAPTLSSGMANNITDTTASVNFISDEVGTYYYLVYTSADASPNAAVIKTQGAAVAKGTSAAVAAANSVAISGLAASTAYKAYVIVEDASSNISSVLTISFSTTAEFSVLGVVDFETDRDGYSVTGAITPSSTACWERTNGSVITPSAAFSYNQGSYYFYGENTDDAASEVYVTLDAVSVAGYSNVQIKILVAGNNDTNSSYEGTEYLKIQYSYDGINYTTLSQFVANNGDEHLTEDANADGTPDGEALSPTFQEFTYGIAENGANLYIKIAANTDQGNEEIGFDNIRILGTPNTAPTVTNVQISGTAAYGQTLTGSYTYSDIDSDAEGTSTFKWYRANDASGTGATEISGATSQTYTLTSADATKYICFEVTPVASAGASPGTAVKSAYVGAVAQLPTTITGDPTASDITYEQALSSSTLSGGSASVAGTFSWTTGSTTPSVSDSGTTPYSVTFTPADNGYSTSTTTVTLIVSKATPTISTNPAASAITYGQTLADSTLSGGAVSTAGTFSWANGATAPAISDSNATEYSVTFTPDDTANYNTATATVTVTVNKATPVINIVPNASTIYYGSSLGYSYLTGGSASVAGTFSWTDNTIVPTVADSGVTGYSVTFTPADSANYGTATTTVTLTINKALSPITTKPTASDIIYGDTLADSVLSGGNAGSDGTFIWNDDTIAPTVTDSGTTYYFVTFMPTDSANYNTETTSVSLTVGKAPTTISTNPTAAAITYGLTLSESALTGGAASTAGAFSWTNGSTVPELSDSNSTLYSVTFTPTDSVNYNNSTTLIRITVNKPAPVINEAPATSAITYGQQLSASILTGGSASVSGTFTWTEDTIEPSVSDSGTTGYSVTFSPDDTDNYSATTTTVTLTVNKATPTVSVKPTASAISYGDTLADSTLSGGTTSVPGTFTWLVSSISPAVSDSGSTSYLVRFTPTDTVNYNTTNTDTTLIVNKATPIISPAPTATDITYGDTLADSALMGGSANTLGTFAWTDGTIAPNASDSDTTPYSVTFTPTDNANYVTATTTVTLTVSKATPTVSVNPTAADIIYGETLADSALSGGTASVAGTFAWTDDTTAPSVSDSGTTLYSVTFTPDNSNYNTVVRNITLNVNKATPTIDTDPAAAAITYGQTLSASALTGGTASTAGTFSWTTGSTAPDITDSDATPYSVTFTPTDSGNYNTQTTAITITVNKANPGAPAAPKLLSKTQTSITLMPVSGYEYIMVADGAGITTEIWQDSNVFDGLTKETSYDFYQRIKETTTHNESAVSAKLDVSTDGDPLTGTASISGTLKVGQTLTASLTGSNNSGTLSYQWMRGSSNISSATGSAYVLVSDDLGKQISVKITSSVQTGTITSAATSAVTAATKQTASPATGVTPILTSKTYTTVTLRYLAGYEYKVVANGASSSTGTWQSSSYFTGLKSGTPYDFYQRVKETSTAYASAVSVKLDVRTYLYSSSSSAATPTPKPTATATSTPAPTIMLLPTATATQTPTATPAPTATQSQMPAETGAGTTRTITGTLLDSNGNPMAGYVVELHSEPRTTITDENGHYSFDNVDYTNHELIVKTTEGDKVADFQLSFSEGRKFNTAVTNEGVDITYTSSTDTVNIEIELVADQNSAAISNVSAVEKADTGASRSGIGSIILWIVGVIIAVLLIALLIFFILYRKREY